MTERNDNVNGAVGAGAQQPAESPAGAAFQPTEPVQPVGAHSTAQMPPVPPTGYAAGFSQEGAAGAGQEPFSGFVPNSAAANGASANPAAGKKQSGAKTFGLAFAGAAVACALVIGGASVVGAVTGTGLGSSTVIGSTSSTATSGSADGDTTLAESVAQKCLPSVVAVDVYTRQSSASYGYGLGSGASSNTSGTLTKSSLGSGVVISADGYIITNYHVIEGADALKVTIEGAEYDAEVVGSDASSDIAVIKAKDVSGLKAVELGDSDNLTVGEWVMTIGSPFGLEQSVATGIVSATNRSTIMSSGSSLGSTSNRLYTNMIQTDAAINPGNSGGALVDSNGKLIGINTLITSSSGSYSGVGFAIPVNYAVQLAQQIINGETPTHAQLGVTLSTINASIAQRYGFSVSSGAYLSSVTDGSGAAQAGLEVGDIVTAFDGKQVTSASDLMLDIRSKNPGDTVTVTVNRNGQSMDFQVTLGSDESTQTQQQQQNSSGGNSGQDANSMLEELLRRYGYGSNGSGDGSSSVSSYNSASGSEAVA